MKRIAFATFVLLYCLHPAIAQDCPTAKHGKIGFAVERTGSSATEIYHLDKGQTRTVGRFVTGDVLEVTHHEGLFQLERIDRGKRSVMTPQSDLPPASVLKVGATIEVSFDQVAAAGQKSVRRVQLKVVGQDKLGIGSCTYDVFKIEERFAQGDAAYGPAGLNYYSPELKLILARSSTGPSGSGALHKFDKIKLLSR
jgi:hypothetical protein